MRLCIVVPTPKIVDSTPAGRSATGATAFHRIALEWSFTAAAIPRAASLARRPGAAAPRMQLRGVWGKSCPSAGRFPARFREQRARPGRRLVRFGDFGFL